MRYCASHGSIIPWPSTCNAPAPKCNGYLESWSLNKKAKMPVQAINGRCLKCGHRLASVLIREKTAAERVDWYKEIIREILGKDRMLSPDDEVF